MRFLEQQEANLPELTTDVQREPHFCSGCPHNTSTRVPDGSRAVGGIGCHYMAAWMDRDTVTLHADGRRGRDVDRPGAVHRHAARVPEPRRRHLRALRRARDPRGRRGRRQHDLQDPVQRCGRDDRRSAGRGAPHGAGVAQQLVGRRRAADHRRERPAGEVRARDRLAAVGYRARSSRARALAARAPRGQGRVGADLRSDLRRGAASQAQARHDPRRRTSASSSTSSSARAAATATCSRIACP